MLLFLSLRAPTQGEEVFPGCLWAGDSQARIIHE